jgi:hypothetical protein
LTPLRFTKVKSSVNSGLTAVRQDFFKNNTPSLFVGQIVIYCDREGMIQVLSGGLTGLLFINKLTAAA